MRYKYISAYQLIGVTPPTDGEEQLLAEYSSVDAKAWITYDLDSHLFESDRASVVGSLILKKFVGQAREGNSEEEVKRELAEFQEKRKKEVENGVFVVFEAIGEVESFSPIVGREFFDYMVSIGAPEGAAPKKQIKEKYQDKINALLASLVLSLDQVCGIKKLKDDVLFINDQGKYVYSFDILGGGKVTITSPLKEDIIDYVRNNAESLGKHKPLDSPTRLLAKSLDEESDELLSFLSAWSGLEILLGKIFKQIVSQIIGRGQPTISPNFLKRLSGKKYNNLEDMFSLVSFELSPSSADDDFEKFDRIKNIRDKMVHEGKDVAISSLPTKETQKLLRKYLKLYLNAEPSLKRV